MILQKCQKIQSSNAPQLQPFLWKTDPIICFSVDAWKYSSIDTSIKTGVWMQKPADAWTNDKRVLSLLEN